MVPNAWLTKKKCLFGHLNSIITFSMHSLKYARVIHPYEMLLKYWRLNYHSLDYRVEPSSSFYEKVHQVKLKYGSNHLAKIRAKDGSSYITALSTAKHI